MIDYNLKLSNERETQVSSDKMSTLVLFETLNLYKNLFIASEPCNFMYSTLGQKRKSLVSGYPTDPNILGPTQTFLKTFGILKSNFRLLLRIFILFQYKKVFIKKSLPTYRPKKILVM